MHVCDVAGLLAVALSSFTTVAASSCGVSHTEKAAFEPKARLRQASPKGLGAQSIAPRFAAANMTADSGASPPEGQLHLGPLLVQAHTRPWASWPGSLDLLVLSVQEPGGGGGYND